MKAIANMAMAAPTVQVSVVRIRVPRQAAIMIVRMERIAIAMKTSLFGGSSMQIFLSYGI